MPQFKCTEKFQFQDRTCAPGETIEYGGNPGNSLAPLDDDAVAAKADAVRRWLSLPATMAGNTPGTISRDPSRHLQVLRIARSLGAPAGVSAANAESFITGWLAAPAVVGAVADPPSISMPSNFSGPPGYQPPSEKWP